MKQILGTAIFGGRLQLGRVAARSSSASSSNCIARRLFSSPPKKAGRERFYIQVGVQPCSPPWAETCRHDGDGVASPVTAGVDDTDSASGVVRNGGGTNMQLLQPKPPKPTLFQDVSTKQEEAAATVHDWFTVTLDGRSLRTPMGRTLALPSQHLAYSIATEWNAVSGTIQPTQMPLMTLSCTALDQTVSQPCSYQQQCLRYLQNDTVCYWADPADDRLLYSRQQLAWKNLHEWIEKEFTSGFPPAQAFGQEGVMIACNDSSSTLGLPHPSSLRNGCEAWVRSLDAWHLTALFSICSEAKSFFVGAGVLTGKLSASDAGKAGRVEEEFNIDIWGLVEGQHDYDRLNCSVQLTAASLLTMYLAEATKAT